MATSRKSRASRRRSPALDLVADVFGVLVLAGAAYWLSALWAPGLDPMYPALLVLGAAGWGRIKKWAPLRIVRRPR
ncbi:hypothetical protein [Allonocardiopsis opalescens]|uniref:Uncharacterized protein n=1 Tax=Allonocardiopsis opalescens TaxID=1144618 RepID=A0A2T0Q954_9ACTN|nr:hypothetical protein [Allonocardiopsis opalescens]PRY00419.1 hypothetical protein CLV72_10248 [Allonocardiopsis opalescens]